MLWTKVASALEGLMHKFLFCFSPKAKGGSPDGLVDNAECGELTTQQTNKQEHNTYYVLLVIHICGSAE